MLGSLVLSSGTYPDLRDPVVAETPRDGGGPSAPNDERVQRIESESHMHQGTALAGVPSPTQGRSTSPNWKSEQQTKQRQSYCPREGRRAEKSWQPPYFTVGYASDRRISGAPIAVEIHRI
jgi:hypothetical protein